MTEIVVTPLAHRTLPVVYPTDWRAFGIAAVLAPLTLACLGVIGLVMGLMFTAITAAASLPGYVGLGLPAAWLAIRHGGHPGGPRPDYGRITVYSLIAVLLLVPIGTVFLLIDGPSTPAEALEGAMTYALIGLFVAPVEALLFAGWYRKLTHEDVPEADPHVFQ